jgi:pimeloyl-ACP methyl ester carboxylesterase
MTNPVAEPKGETILVNGINVKYWDWGGSGPNMVMLHPSSGYGRIWDHTARLLYPDFRIIAPDQRGHGDTDKPDSGYSGEDFTADLRGLVEALGLGKIAIVGHSLGGRVAMIYGGLYPNDVSHIVLVGGPHYVSLFEVPVVRESRSIAQGQVRPQTKFASADEAYASLRRARPTWTDEAVQHAIVHNMNHYPDGAVEFKYDPEKVALGLSHIPDNLTKYVRRITCPVLFACGPNSPQLPIDRARQAASLFADCRIVDVEGSEYWIEAENPVALARVIREFISSRV